MRRHTAALVDLTRRQCTTAAIGCHQAAWPAVPEGVSEQRTLAVLLGLRVTRDLLAIRSELGRTPNALLLRAMDKAYSKPIFGGPGALMQHILLAHAAFRKAQSPGDAVRLHAMGQLGTTAREHARFHAAIEDAFRSLQPLIEIIRERA